ncbi:hypothetical protein Vadar_008774 [Vaccinium darrowii]|uniref:Uncharacterized protein n=1 Tax=Vaccinium darrowii TaxID=229202 RepID=A0ACB7XG99_9ERIC|nr:hypothetical protein Vadar_008774 [Vaccinium darrowii]
MSSISIQSGIRGNFTCPSFTSHKPGFKPFKTSSIPVKHKAFCLHSPTIIDLRSKPIRRIQLLSASSTAEAFTAEDTSDTEEESDDLFLTKETEEPEPEVEVKKKPRLVLKFIWMEKNIGLGLDQMIQGHGTVPLSPYFFWPRKDAWEELKTTLESKPWISQKRMIILLNQATDIINLWQQSGGNLS